MEIGLVDVRVEGKEDGRWLISAIIGVPRPPVQRPKE